MPRILCNSGCRKKWGKENWSFNSQPRLWDTITMIQHQLQTYSYLLTTSQNIFYSRLIGLLATCWTWQVWRTCDSTHQEKITLSTPFLLRSVSTFLNNNNNNKIWVLFKGLWDTMTDSSELIVQTVRHKAKEEQQSYFVISVFVKRFLKYRHKFNH